jgi:hypothetical protein
MLSRVPGPAGCGGFLGWAERRGETTEAMVIPVEARNDRRLGRVLMAKPEEECMSVCVRQ